MKNYYLGREETYKISPQVWTYDLLKPVVNGIQLNFCNTDEEFPFDFNGRTYAESMRLFMCGEWSDNTEEHHRIQNTITYTCTLHDDGTDSEEIIPEPEPEPNEQPESEEPTEP